MTFGAIIAIVFFVIGAIFMFLALLALAIVRDA